MKLLLTIVGLRTVFGIWDLPVNGKGKKKAKLHLCLTDLTLCHEDVGEWSYSSTILDLDARWR
jgi:hypothetical protein